MPSWKIENAATAAAVAFPLLDVAGIVGEGQLVIVKKSTVCRLLFLVEYMSSLWRIKCHRDCLREWRGPRFADAEF